MKSKATFNIEVASDLANLSRIAYDEFEKDEATFRQKLKRYGYELIDLISDIKSDTEGFVAVKGDHAYLCFRGTYEVPSDIIMDLTARMVDDYHEGIYGAIKAVRSQIEAAIKKVGNKEIYCTGHSLGGGLAKVAILTMPELNWKACYTYGSPAICSKSRSQSNQVPTFLLVNVGDIVSRIMDIHGFGEGAELITKAVYNHFEGKGLNSSPLKSLSEYVSNVNRDMKSYCHFGEIRYLTREGRFLKNADSMDLFKKAIGTNLKIAIEDHAIAQYIVNLERYRDNRII